LPQHLLFCVKRAADQVSSSIAYPGLNVKICATHAGISVGEDGATHQAIEDVAIMRAIPGIVVLSPCDATETRQVIEKAVDYFGPMYIRLTRSNIPVIFNENYKKGMLTSIQEAMKKFQMITLVLLFFR